VEKFSPFWSGLHAKKGDRLPRIAFSDGSDPRIIESAQQLKDGKLAEPILIQGKSTIQSADLARYRTLLLEKQARLKVTEADVDAQLSDSLYLGIALLLDGRVDGLVAGSLRPTADVVKAALRCIGPKTGQRIISGHFLVESARLSSSDKTPFLFADCAVMPEPSVQSLAAIARSAAESYRFFTGGVPRVALLSFSTRGSAEHPLVDRIRQALELIRKQEPSLIVDGEIQADAALDAGVAKIKNAAGSPIAGKANVFIFPTLEAGNISYKLIQRFSESRVAGPLLWGLNKPVSDLSRGCTVQEVTDTALCVSAMARMN
jgi:phosphate acetyltransferase